MSTYESIEESPLNEKGKKTNGKEKCLIFFLIFFIVLSAALLTGMLLYRREAHRMRNPYARRVKQDFKRQAKIRDRLFAEINTTNIRKDLRQLTEKVHVAGTEQNMKVMEMVHDAYVNNGLDKVWYTNYEVLLDYPDYKQPNTISVQDNATDWTLICNGTGQLLGPQEAQEQETATGYEADIWWNGYSKNGTAEGTIVFANYGDLDDFEELEKQNVSVNGSIALIRYGGIFRGKKMRNAWRHGAIGVIIYTDPADYGPPASSDESFVFPNSIYMPPFGTQKGAGAGSGDLQTPYYPAKSYTYKWYSVESLRQGGTIPDIPVMPIGYGAAREILSRLDGKDAPSSFQGGLRNQTYRLTGSKTFRLSVRSNLSPNTKIRNVIGYLRGSEEPDRYILLSNHVDAWTNGAQDPNSGTAISMELSRAFMAVRNQTGWRPRRTLVFCSWDAEEYGLIGSNEFTEEYLRVLEIRAVAVVNVDIAVKGNVSFNADTVPLLYRMLTEASKHVSNPNSDETNAGRTTVYDSWLHYSSSNSSAFPPLQDGVPYMAVPGSGSDHERFLTYVGIPVVDMTYKCVVEDCYKLYHSLYEVSWTMEHLVDPDFSVSHSIAELWAEIVRSLSDSLLIPFNVSDYATMLSVFLDDLETFLAKNGITSKISNYQEVSAGLKTAIDNFKTEAKKFQSKVDKGNSGSAKYTLAQVTLLNDRLNHVERSFLDPKGLPDRLFPIKHVTFAPSANDDYTGVTFAGVRDPVESYVNAVKSGNLTEQERSLRNVELGLTAIRYGIESAILVLELDQFWTETA